MIITPAIVHFNWYIVENIRFLSISVSTSFTKQNKFKIVYIELKTVGKNHYLQEIIVTHYYRIAATLTK